MAEVVFGWAVRTRTIKGGFWTDEDLAELPAMTRFIFAGLFAVADREGRFPDKPKKIKRLLFPGDDVDVCEAIGALELAGLLTRYAVDGVKYVQLRNFTKHQRPHPREAPSSIPACPRTHLTTSKVEPRTSLGMSKAALSPSEPSEPSTFSQTHPSSVREGAARVPTSDGCVSSPSAPMPPFGQRRIARSDADLLPYFQAYCAGSGQGLTWKQAYFIPTEQLFAHGKPPERVRTVAAFYRSKLKDATASFARFAAEIDKWDAECGAQTMHRGPKAKTADEWAKEGRCPKHPAEPADCEVCKGFAEYQAKHAVPA